MGNQVHFREMWRASLDRQTGRDTTPPTFIIHLYKNNIIPVYGATVITDFVESDFQGYSTHPLASWGTPTFNYPHVQSVHPVLLWACSGPAGGSQDAFGYYVTDGSGNLLWAERFGSPPPMNDVPDYVYFRPIFRYESLYHSAFPTDPLVASRIMSDGRFLFCNAALGLAFPTGFNVHLYQNDPGITDTLSLSSFTECDFGSYTPKSANTWSATAFNPVSGFEESNAGNKFWTVGAGGPSQSAYGYFLTETSSGNLIAARRFLSPMSANPGDFLSCLPLLSNYTEFTA